MKKFFILLLLFLVILGIVAYSTAKSRQNKMVTLHESVEAQWGQVQNVYQRRADLIPNLVQTVKGYSDFEQETLTRVTEARARVGQISVDSEVLDNPEKMKQFADAQSELGQTLSRLLVVTENYPDLKANENFQNLMVQLEGTENRITVERMKFNEAARDYNTYVKQFPTNIFAGLFGFETVEYFEGGSGIEEAPEVNFE